MEEGLEAGAARRRRRGKAAVKSLSDLQAEWAWLADMRREDQPWLFFALYKAYESQVTLKEIAYSMLKRCTCQSHPSWSFTNTLCGRLVRAMHIWSVAYTASAICVDLNLKSTVLCRGTMRRRGRICSRRTAVSATPTTTTPK